MARSSGDTRQAILEAACQIVREKGVTHLTLEAAARMAGVSKGGLLYHFPSKDALVEAIIADQDEIVKGHFQQVIEAQKPEGPGDWTRLFLRMTIRPAEPLVQLHAGLLAAVGENPDLLDPVRKQGRIWQHRLENDGIDPAVATIVHLVSQGLIHQALFGFDPVPEPLLSQVKATLEALTRGEPPTTPGDGCPGEPPKAQEPA